MFYRAPLLKPQLVLYALYKISMNSVEERCMYSSSCGELGKYENVRSSTPEVVLH